MLRIEVLAGASIPYQQDKLTNKWVGTKVNNWKTESKFVVDFAVEADKKIRKRVKSHGKIAYPLNKASLPYELEMHLDEVNPTSFEDFVSKVHRGSGIFLSSTRVQSKLVLIFLKYKKIMKDESNDSLKESEFFLAILLKDKTALKFDDQGAPSATDIIDFEDVMQAATFSVGDFKASLENQESPDISFLGGVTDYFAEFMNAEDVLKNKESVENLFSALSKFVTDNSLRRKDKENCQDSVKELLDKNSRNKLPTKLEDVSYQIYSSLKKNEELKLEKDSFEEFVREHSFKVNDEFEVTKKDSERLEFISFDTDVGNLKIRRSLINSSESDDICFKENTNELIIKTKIYDKDVLKQLKQFRNEDR